jgi:hypothetical protein
MSASKDAGPDRSTADIALVCTHKGELRPFLKRLDRQRSYTEGSLTVRGGFLRETIRIVVAEVGPGFARHRAAAHWLVETHKPAWMLAVGFSSSLTPEVHPGDRQRNRGYPWQHHAGQMHAETWRANSCRTTGRR